MAVGAGGGGGGWGGDGVLKPVLLGDPTLNSDTAPYQLLSSTASVKHHNKTPIITNTVIITMIILIIIL